MLIGIDGYKALLVEAMVRLGAEPWRAKYLSDRLTRFFRFDTHRVLKLFLERNWSLVEIDRLDQLSRDWRNSPFSVLRLEAALLGAGAAPGIARIFASQNPLYNSDQDAVVQGFSIFRDLGFRDNELLQLANGRPSALLLEKERILSWLKRVIDERIDPLSTLHRLSSPSSAGHRLGRSVWRGFDGLGEIPSDILPPCKVVSEFESLGTLKHTPHRKAEVASLLPPTDPKTAEVNPAFASNLFLMLYGLVQPVAVPQAPRPLKKSVETPAAKKPDSVPDVLPGYTHAIVKRVPKKPQPAPVPTFRPQLPPAPKPVTPKQNWALNLHQCILSVDPAWADLHWKEIKKKHAWLWDKNGHSPENLTEICRWAQIGTTLKTPGPGLDFIAKLIKDDELRNLLKLHPDSLHFRIFAVRSLFNIDFLVKPEYILLPFEAIEPRYPRSGLPGFSVPYGVQDWSDKMKELRYRCQEIDRQGFKPHDGHLLSILLEVQPHIFKRRLTRYCAKNGKIRELATYSKTRDTANAFSPLA